MFERRELSADLAAVRDVHAPEALVLDSDGDFETLPPSVAENLLAVVDGVDPTTYDESNLVISTNSSVRELSFSSVIC